jgi:hypothetical protein
MTPHRVSVFADAVPVDDRGHRSRHDDPDTRLIPEPQPPSPGEIWKPILTESSWPVDTMVRIEASRTLAAGPDVRSVSYMRTER